MLILNQSKDTVYNMDKIISIECTENGVGMQGDKAESSITLGTYESEARAKEVLWELFFIYGAAQYVLNAHKTSYANVRDIYEMPAK